MHIPVSGPYAISTRDCRSSSEQLRRLFSLTRSTCGAVQNTLSLLFLVLRPVSCRRYLPCHGSALPTAPQAHWDVRLVQRSFQYTVAGLAVSIADNTAVFLAARVRRRAHSHQQRVRGEWIVP